MHTHYLDAEFSIGFNDFTMMRVYVSVSHNILGHNEIILIFDKKLDVID